MPESEVEASGVKYSTSRDLKQLFLQDFDRLDSGKQDGMLTIDEIDTAVTDNTIKGEHAELVGALKEYFGPLKKLANDQTGFETGITIADIEAFDALQKRVNDPTEIKSTTQKEQLLVRGVDYAMVETKFAAMNTSPCLYANPATPEACIIPDAVCSDQNHVQEGVDGIKPTAFRQGKLGNCYFMAALASLSSVDPHAIVKMIKDNHDGTYTVTFPISPNEPITVNSPSEVERARYTRTFSIDGSSPNYGDWPIIMEKAFGKWCVNRPLRLWRRSPAEWIGDKGLGNKVPQENSDSGSAIHRGLWVLTGKWPHVDFCINNNEKQLHAALSSISERKIPATAFISRKLIGSYTDDAKLLSAHEYGILGYDPETRMVTIREPNGYFEPCDTNDVPEDGVRDGVFKISVERFRKNFSGIAYERKFLP
jgi:hypothetical protein